MTPLVLMAIRAVCHECEGPCQEGLLFCEACAPPGAYRQDATIFVQSIVGVTDMGTVTLIRGDGSTASTPLNTRPAEPVPEPQDTRRKSARLRGRVFEPGTRAHIEVVQERDVWNHDRKRREDMTRYINRTTDVYREVWTLPGTTEVTWESEPQRLTDHKQGGPRPGRATGI
jgi:hypothetical protein